MSDAFDRFAAELLGTYVLAGVTDVDRAGVVVGHWQVHGRVIQVDEAKGVVVRTASGAEHWLPPDPDSYTPADPGEYRLTSTGEVVVDPDYLTTWTRHPPDRH